MIYKIAVIILLITCLTGGMAPAQERMAVRGAVANIRSGPNIDNAVLWQAEKYYPVLILEKNGDWRHFKDFEGDQGWIHASLLGPIKSVIVKANQCNVRTGPGTQYNVAFTVDKGIPFKVLQTKGKWLEVQHADGDGGWIHKGLVW
jgi:SH3-like domain-containing protein